MANKKLHLVHPARPTPSPSAPPTISGRWLLGAIAATVLAAALCAWGALCLLFWQGSWQLLYHPAAAITRTPASAGIAFEPIGFAAMETGQLRLQGWWLPATPGARFSRFTVLYLHGQNGNLSDTVPALARLHGAGVNVFAFDYRGYGQSQFAHPTEARWRQDAEWALRYLTGTRHLDPHSILVDGSDLGANLALEVGAAHPELAGVLLDTPLADPMAPVFSDARARLVPARLLMRDRYSLDAAAPALHIPLLWFTRSATVPAAQQPPRAFDSIPSPKMLVRLTNSASADKDYSSALSRWLDSLPAR